MALRKCIKCGEEKSAAHFIGVNSKLHNGALPICRECIGSMIAAAPKDENWNLVDKLCQWADVPFIPEEWTKIYEGQTKDAFGIYVSVFRSKPYDTLDWQQYNSVYLQIQEEGRVEDALPETKAYMLEKRRQKWGHNYDEEELEYLENLHQGLLNSQNIVGALNEDQALKLCKISLIIEQKIRGGADFSKDLKAYDDLSKLANITPKAVKDANEFNSVGEIFAWLEKKGWVNQYYDGAVKDEVDFTIKDIKYWLRYLYVQETGIAEEVEQRIKNLRDAAKETHSSFNEQELRDYIANAGNIDYDDTDEEFEVVIR